MHIVRGGTKTRFQDKLYLFNLVGLIPYLVIVILAIIFRYNSLDENGHCYIGLQRASSFPLLIYDLLINVSLPPFVTVVADSDLPYRAIPLADARLVLVSHRAKPPSATGCATDISRHRRNTYIKYCQYQRCLCSSGT